jgi:glyoxylase-like metal-dependent hydrolase (beta-lactamase superfamily II)/rhodanese-related sulfurtransferase
MFFEQFYLGCLAHASYMIASEGEAAVVDPQRDVEIYLQAAQEHGCQIKHIFETHVHADFVSGHKELAERTGATIYVGEQAGAKYPHQAMRDGFEVKMGKVRISAIATPGHTLGCTCLAVTDEEKSPQPWAVLTGDTLFIGDVGRPDLSKSHTPQQLAGLLYDSLQKLMALPNECLVYPAHGAGSLCGRNMRAERSSTIGTERLTNYALQFKSKDEFVAAMTAHLPKRPDYFFEDARINTEGAAALAELPKLMELSPADFQAAMEEGITALDVRPMEQFAAGHVPGSVNIALAGQFASWAGSVLGLSAKLVLVAESDEKAHEARMRLARVGIEDVHGFLAGGIEAWQSAGLAIAQTPQVTVEELAGRLGGGGVEVLDVRREGEFEAGHIADADLWPLDNFHAVLPKIPNDVPVAVHCKGGYRSMVACSLLQKAGFDNVINVVGGFDAWQAAKLPVETEAEVAKA